MHQRKRLLQLRDFAQWSFLAIHSEVLRTMPAEVELFSCMRSLTTVLCSLICNSAAAAQDVPRVAAPTAAYWIARTPMLLHFYPWRSVCMRKATCTQLRSCVSRAVSCIEHRCCSCTFSNMASSRSRRPQIRWGRQQTIAIVYLGDFYK